MYPWESEWESVDVQYFPEEYDSVTVFSTNEFKGIYKVSNYFGHWPKGVPVYQHVSNYDKQIYWDPYGVSGWNFGDVSRLGERQNSMKVPLPYSNWNSTPNRKV